MPVDRDVAAFDGRADRYDQGMLGRLHREIVERTVTIALSAQPNPSRVLDVGCGPGYLLRVLASRCPEAVQLSGVDPAQRMTDLARATATDPRVAVMAGSAEHLPFPDDAFDLVLSTTSFDHWADQKAGLAQCGRVLTPGGRLVITDLFSPLLIPTLVQSRRDKARTKSRATQLLTSVGLRVSDWHALLPLVKVVVAVR